MANLFEALTPEETTEEVKDLYADLITPDVDFRVETRGLQTEGENIMHMPNHEATIRVNPDGHTVPLWVVGSLYEVVDHKEVIRGFAESLNKAGLEANVHHKVYLNGCRIYSFFTLKNTYHIGEKKVPIQPFFTLTTSHDGSMKLGFMVGARVAETDTYLNVNKTVYGAWAKHTHGVNIEKTLEEIERALDAFVSEVIPMWEKMHSMATSPDMVKCIIENAVKKKVLSKRRAENLPSGSGSVWDTYINMVKEVSEVRGKRGTEERAFDRNTSVGEYFQRMMKNDAEALRALVKEEGEEE
jgi:hypothetical protein